MKAYLQYLRDESKKCFDGGHRAKLDEQPWDANVKAVARKRRQTHKQNITDEI